MTNKLAAGALVCAALGFTITHASAQTAVGPGAPVQGSSPPQLAVMLPDGPGRTPQYSPTDFGPLASDAQGRALLQQIEAKWGPLMRGVLNWDANAFDQFYEGYKNYPVSVLQKALRAPTYETMDAELMAYPAALAQRNAGLAFNFAKTKPEDITKDALELRKAAVKALGDDAKDLVFIPTVPCTVWDTRFAFGPPVGPAIGNGVTREFYSHYNGAGTDFSSYGGNPSCAENNFNFLGARPFAVMMIVYVSNATANGWLTFYRDGDPDPSNATISVYYSSGPTRTQTVISKSSRGYGSGAYDIAVTGRFATADASASVVGYFLKPQATALDCLTTSDTDTVLPNGVLTQAPATACPAGYTHVSVLCSNGGTQALYLTETGNSGAFSCSWYNLTGSSQTGYVRARCCRVPGH